MPKQVHRFCVREADTGDVVRGTVCDSEDEAAEKVQELENKLSWFQKLLDRLVGRSYRYQVSMTAELVWAPDEYHDD